MKEKSSYVFSVVTLLLIILTVQVFINFKLVSKQNQLIDNQLVIADKVGLAYDYEAKTNFWAIVKKNIVLK